jgi:hypothetical protein
MLKIALFILMAAEIASAQTTWKGLRFGMGEVDVRKEYPASFEKKPLQNGGFALLDRGQKLAGSQATAELFFDKNGKLEQIDLSMKDPFTGEPNSSPAAGSTLAVISILTDKLVEKYGASTTQKGTCELTAADLVPPDRVFTCDRLWRSDDQTIDMYFVVARKLITSFTLEYKPLATDI